MQSFIGDLPEGFDDNDFDDEEELGIIGGKIKIRLDDMDVPSWKHDLKNDLFIIDRLLLEMDKITPDDDYKLRHLQDLIDEKIAHPINPGNRKILIFTAFADTANYLYEQLAPHFLNRHGL